MYEALLKSVDFAFTVVSGVTRVLGARGGRPPISGGGARVSKVKCYAVE